MIDSYHHVTLNGINYRLAEDAEGQHYNQRWRPLRLQTSAVVQGEAGKFQMRPDILQWSLTDWSGGEGLLVFHEGEGNRYHESHNVDPFDEVGKLKLAKAYEETNDEGDVALTEIGNMTKARDLLHAFDPDNDTVRTWDDANSRWSAETANAEGGFGTIWDTSIPAGDHLKAYNKERSQAALWSWNGSTFVEHCTDWGVTAGEPTIVSIGDYLYFQANTGVNAKIIEVPKFGTPPVTSKTILDLSNQGSTANLGLLCSGDNALYLAQLNADSTVMYKITPTTANGAGFAEEIMRLKGFRCTSIWYHMGVVFLGGRIGFSGDSREQVVMYVRGSEVGVLANLRPGTASGGDVWGANEAQSFQRAYFVAKYGPGDNTHEWTLFATDLISGAVAGLTVINAGEDVPIESIITHGGDVFMSKDTQAGTNRIWRTLPSTYVDTSSLTARLDSSVNDFGLKDEKVLLSVRLQCEPLAAGDTIQLLYQINQDAVWTSIGTLTTDSSIGTTFVISTDSSSITFQNLQIRIVPSNTGTTSVTPVITGVDIFATVARGVTEWQLMLDLSDDQGGEGVGGAAKISNITAASAVEKVVQFDDGYENREPNDFDGHDVIIEDFDIILSNPGEGIARVTLREVT